MPKRQSVDHATMRDMNMTLILRTLHEHAPLSRMELAKSTRLNKAAISGMVRELIRVGLVYETGLVETEAAEVGRPAINLDINPDAGVIISVEIEVRQYTIVVTNFRAEIVSRYTAPLQPNATTEVVLAQMVTDIQNEIVKLPVSTFVFGLGIGIPGIVERPSGRLVFAPNLGWRDVALQDYFAAAFDLPVYVDNEANLAALGESYFSNSHKEDVVVYIVGNEGIGGGVMINGRLMGGQSGFAGEIGHMTVQEDGTLCNCGNRGCWETLIGWDAIVQRIEQSKQQGLESELTRTCSIEELVQAAIAGDEVATQVLEETGYWLGLGIASLINIFNPGRIILGGRFSRGYEQMAATISRVVEERSLGWPQRDCTIMPSTYGQDSCIMGGVATIHRHVLNHQIEWPVEATTN